MVIGTGDLCCRLVDLLLADPATSHVVLAGRDPVAAERQVNLARFTAANLDRAVQIRSVGLDLDDVDAAADVIAQVKPDIIFMGASLQSWRVITQLPAEIFEALDEAQFGPWLPMHLSLNHALMKAVSRSGVEAEVVNAAFPDAVGPVLAKVGLAPTIGIGNVANIIPALTQGYADLLEAPVGSVQLRLVAQHYFSHYVPRFGTAGRGSYHLSATLDGVAVPAEQVSHAAVFSRLVGPLKRVGGLRGQQLTASSAARVLTAMASDSGALVHAPSPNGLPGGYPVTVGRHGGVPDLDSQLSLPEAVRINEECQRADGIERIDDDGTVTFTEPEMRVMANLLGYSCRSMTLDDTPGWAEELSSKYSAFAAQYV